MIHLFREYGGIPIVIAIGVFISYQLAKAQEPQSLWLWRDVLGVVKP